MNTWVELDGARVYAEEVGDGPTTIVVPPAWGVSHEFYQALLGELGLPLRLIYFDPEGTGASGRLPTGWNSGRILDEVEAVRSQAGGGQSVLLLGHAGGAFLSLAYALDHPHNVAGLILVSPFAGYRRTDEMSAPRLESHPQWSSFQQRVREIKRVEMTPAEQFRAIFKEQRVVDMFDYGPHYFQMADAADEADFNPDMHENTETDLLDELPAIEAPVLIVTGEDDPLSPLEECRLIAGELPYVRLIELPRCGHYPFVEAPEAFTTAVEDFLADLD